MSTATADAEAAAARVNQEQVFHELEQKYLLLKADFAVLESERDAAVEQKNGTAEQAKTLQTTVEEREAELVKVKDELLKLRTERDQLSFQVRAATSQAERRLNDVEELQQTVKDQNKQLMESQRKEMDALQKVAEQDAIVEPLRHSVNRVNAELESTKQHLEWAEKQLTEKTKLVQDLRQSSTKIAHDHEELKTRHAEELASLRKQLESSRQVSKKLESSLVQSKEQMKEIQAARIHEEERLRNELSAQRRLADLYKDSAEDANVRINELQELCENLRHSLAESEDALAHQEERTKQQVEHIFREQAAASERRIEVLQDELKETQDRLEELQKNKLLSLQTASTVSGLSSAAGIAHLAANGVTPKELCDQILSLETALRAERDEKEQLQISLNRVVEEVREKAPMIMGLKQDLQQAMASNAKQSDQLQVYMQDLVKYRARERAIMDDKQLLERKCEAFSKSVDDLSRQVQHLLFRAHESSLAEGNSSATGGSAAENLVVFKDVEELQVRNQQLLMVIRELTEAQKHTGNSAHLIGSGESDDDSDGEARASSSLGKRLNDALDEVEKLRTEREEERKMISAIVQQRDMYRVLLLQADSKFSDSADQSGPAASTTGVSNATQQHHRTSLDVNDSKALRELQKDFDIYKKEKQASMKALQDELDRARSESSEFRLSQMQAQVEAKCNKDRYEAAEKRRQDSEEEVLRIRAKSDQISNLLVQHQKLLAEAEAKFDAAATKLRALEVEKDGALRELAFMKKNETKMLQDLATMRLDNTNLLKLMDTNRQIDSSREERERRDSDRLVHKLSVLENKLQEAYDKLESNDAVAGAKIAAEEQAKKIAVAELAQLKDQLATVREQLARVEEQLAAATNKSSLHEKEVTHLREQLRKGASAAAAERVSALEVQLRQSQLEAQSAVEMKKSLLEAVSKYKAIAEANEKSLSELSAASESWKTELERKLADVESERDTLRRELDKARSQIKDDVSEGNKLREEMDKMVMSHQSKLHQSQERQQQLQIEAEAARAQLNALQQEVSTLRDDVSTAQENYERELKLHASQVEKYSSTRKQVQDEQNKNRALLSEVGELKARVMVAEKEAAESIASMEKMLMDANHSKSSLAEQNKLLHAQLERANNELRRAHEAELLQNVGGTGPAAQSDVRNDREHTKELDDLRSVIAYLRKESEILSSKFELSHQENERYRLQVQGLETTIERLRQDLKDTETSSTVAGANATTVAAKSAAQLEQLDLLRESNATLREESQRNLARVRVEEERVKNLEAQLGPLRNSETLLKAQIESLKQEMTALTDANKRWKQRVEQLVEKYQQIDPAEHERVCTEKAAIAKELAELQAKEAALKTELETLKSSEGKNAEEEKGKTENLRKQYDRIKGFAKSWKTKAEALTKQMAEKSKEAEDKASFVVELEKKLAQSLAEKSALESKLSAVEASKSDSAGALWDKERQELKDKVDAETKRFSQLKDINTKLMSGYKALKQENAQLKEQVSNVTTTQQEAAIAPPSEASVTTLAPKQPPLPDTESTSVPVPAVPSKTTVDAADVAPAKSPLRAPMSTPPLPAAAPLPTATPSLVPTLKTVGGATGLNPAAKPFVAVAASSAPVKPPVVTPIVASPAKTPAQSEAKEPAAPIPSLAPSTANTPAAELSEEDKLRLTLQQSMMKKFKKPANAGAKPVATVASTTPSNPVTTTVANVALAKPPLPVVAAKPTVPAQPQAFSLAPPKPLEEVKSAPAASNPSVAPTGTTTTFGAGSAFGSGSFGTGAVFGAGGASGLVFGKPGITLPVPASPTPVPIASSATTSPSASTLFASVTNANAQAPSTETPVVTTVGTETEAQRRSQRLARFAAAGETATDTSATPATLKRPATAEPETATPQKMAKLNQVDPNTSTSAEVVAEDSEATEDEATLSAASSPPAE